METANATKKTKTGITELQTASIFSIADRMALKLILNTPNGNTETTFVGIRIRISGGFIWIRIRLVADSREGGNKPLVADSWVHDTQNAGSIK